MLRVDFIRTQVAFHRLVQAPLDRGEDRNGIVVIVSNDQLGAILRKSDSCSSRSYPRADPLRVAQRDGTTRLFDPHPRFQPEDMEIVTYASR